MDVLDVVLRKEGDGNTYYRRCGSDAGIAGVSRIFEMLSEDEMRHTDALRALTDGVRVEFPPSPTLESARRILRTLSVEQDDLYGFSGDPRCLLSSMDFEATTAGACCELARQANSGWERELLLKIAAEDEIHFTVIEHMRELLTELSEGGADDGGEDVG